MAKRREKEFRRELSRLVPLGPDVQKIEKLYDRLLVATSDLERGKWLIEIRSILERGGNFGRFLNGLPLFALRSAYRYINGFETCQRNLPPAVLKEAMEMDLPMYGDDSAPFGRFTNAIKATPPPKNPSPNAAREWLEGILAATPRYGPRTNDPERVLQECFRVFANRTAWLDLTRRAKIAFLSKLVGMQMTHWGIEITTFEPVAISDNLKPRNDLQRARPARSEAV